MELYNTNLKRELVIRETAKAILVELPRAHDGNPRETWLPKSHCFWLNGELLISEWIAAQKQITDIAA